MSKSDSTSLQWLPTHLLTIAFVVLKLCKVIDWSWYWVLSPLWINVVGIIIIGIIYTCWRLYRDKHRPKTEEEQLVERIKDLQRECNEYLKRNNESTNPS